MLSLNYFANKRILRKFNRLFEMLSLKLGISRVIIPTVRNVSRFVSVRPQQIWLKHSCISPSLPVKVSPCTRYFSISSFRYQENREQKPNPSSTKRKSDRKRRTVIEDEHQPSSSPQWEVVAYSTAEEYDLKKLMQGLQQQGLYHPSSMSEDIHDVLHVSARYQVDREPREIYFFREGSVVFWNVSELERKNVLLFLKICEDESYDKDIVAEGNEKMVYAYTEVFNKTRLMNGRILLNDEGSTDLEKYTFSNALALSVKLATWEASLEKYVDSIEFVVEDLKEVGRIQLSRSDVLKKQGELFSLRHLINLSSDLLDTPDFYWDRENLETLYHKTCNHLNISKRTKVMNEKLNHCVELVELLSRQLTDAHHTRLEWMIIALITVEVGFEVVHLFHM